MMVAMLIIASPKHSRQMNKKSLARFFCDFFGFFRRVFFFLQERVAFELFKEVRCFVCDCLDGSGQVIRQV